MRTKLFIATAIAGSMLLTGVVSGSAQAAPTPVLKSNAAPGIVTLARQGGGGGMKGMSRGGGGGHALRNGGGNRSYALRSGGGSNHMKRGSMSGGNSFARCAASAMS